MIKNIFSFELSYWFKKWQFYVYILIAFSLAYLTMLGEGGFFDSNTATVSSLRQLNSPNGVVAFIGGFTTLLYFFLPAIFGTAINKDFATQTHEVLYAYPFSKFQYLFGCNPRAFDVNIKELRSS